ncbi:dephospho-CoA kinase [Pelagibius litoralis]|uniref:Dephospho-CoA kinase n=1 Tax=Pelagibius litoralis TaxID=374515 RepID=A0A967KAM1_9PROT|nr:dephospho-CoA kinase [Pelagibius litoralis]NIA71713.1 dephospho-CoA kinase [Pelagibius litoralis]
MLVIGLTGSIGMGKSTAVAMLRRLGLPVHDADAAVHRLMAKGGAAVAAVEAAFPGVVVEGAVDRARLASKVLGDPAALSRLEAILHPLARASARAFLAQQARLQRPLAVLDIPLLFETGGEKICDAVIVVSAPAATQRARVMARPGMTEERFQAILAQQMPDAEKRRRADFVVQSGLNKAHALQQLRSIVTVMKGRAAAAPPPLHKLFGRYS